MRARLPVRTLALGKDIRLRLGDVSAKLTAEQVKALRLFVSTFQPQM